MKYFESTRSYHRRALIAFTQGRHMTLLRIDFVISEVRREEKRVVNTGHSYDGLGCGEEGGGRFHCVTLILRNRLSPFRIPAECRN
jgi:hypothetical protein